MKAISSEAEKYSDAKLVSIASNTFSIIGLTISNAAFRVTAPAGLTCAVTGLLAACLIQPSNFLITACLLALASTKAVSANNKLDRMLDDSFL